MNTPLVSICLPNLNTRAFLEERVQTILDQTYTNWELIVSDNYSDDGSWEYFQGLARTEPRVSVAQAPREGLYPNWNNCLRRTRGEYIYIATSDDTMASDYLEKLVRAMGEHPDCELGHCGLRIIDTQGRELPDLTWPECTVFAHGLGDIRGTPHIRRAPYDGLIHLTGQHVVLSITQILIRKSLFARTGEFGSQWGSVSDFNWEMKAGLVANMIHVPDTWASWRVHSTQATASVDIYDPARDRKFDQMVDDAVAHCLPMLPPQVAEGLTTRWVPHSRKMRGYYAGLRHRRQVFARRGFQLQQALLGSAAVRAEILGRTMGRPKWVEQAPAELRAWLESLGMTPIEIVSHSASADRYGHQVSTATAQRAGTFRRT